MIQPFPLIRKLPPEMPPGMELKPLCALSLMYSREDSP
jgi:hypothetical protein